MIAGAPVLVIDPFSSIRNLKFRSAKSETSSDRYDRQRNSTNNKVHDKIFCSRVGAAPGSCPEVSRATPLERRLL